MKILVLSDAFPPDVTGGAARVALTQCQALQQLGHQVHVLSTRRSNSEPADSEINGIPVHRLAISYPMRWQAYLSLYNPAAASGVRRLISAIQPDVIHAHNIHAYLTYGSLAIAKRSGLPVVLTLHDLMTIAYQKFDSYIDPGWQHIPDRFDYQINPWSQMKLQRFRYFPLRNFFIRLILRRCVDAAISPSAALLEVLEANGLRLRRMVCVPNGVNSAEFESSAQEQAEFRSEYNLTGKGVILLAGRLNAAKGALQMLKAMPRIIAKAPQAMLLVLAPPDRSGEGMSAIAESLGIGHYIRFAGWLSGRKLAAAFGAADVCVVPSVYFDNFPTVNLEAMAAGTPVVATCFGGSREVVAEGETGFIVNPFNIEMLAQRIITILGDEDLRRRMSTQAQERARERYDWLRQATRLVEIYREVQAGE
jgi:glycosyltransferase involved in cell wall biosynthesis